MQPDVNRMKAIKRGLAPVIALLIASAPGLHFGIRSLYVAGAVAAWVYGDPSIEPHERKAKIRKAVFTACFTLALQLMMGSRAAGQKRVLTVNGSSSSAAAGR